MTRFRTLASLSAVMALCLTPAGAYYHYVHYLTSSPYTLASEKFDVTTLPNNTVTFFVSDSGPIAYSNNDSFPSVLSEIRDAARVWDSVPTSGLRVHFGGLQVQNTPQNTPGGEVVFEELPPGLLAFSGPQSQTTPAQDPNGVTFFPIVKSIIHLNIDMTKPPGPSYLEGFFTTVVHEMGHALGLQHTYTSATMSTAITRATSRARPLDADDIAAISLLYPAGDFPTGYGSISGQVTASGQGVHLASVVALLPNGSAISNLTNPDGTYEIDGIPPGNYWVYVHPLPPTANIRYPLDANNNYVVPTLPFATVFYPGVTTPSQFSTVPVAAGNVTGGINFSVQLRSNVQMYDISPYSYPSPVPGQLGQIPVLPAYLNASANAPFQTVVANGFGITSGTAATPGLSVQVLGGPGPIPCGNGSTYCISYGSPDTSIAVYLQYPSPPPAGPEHLLFTLPDDIYVLPQAIQIVERQPPMVTGLTPNGDGTATVAGSGLGSDSKVFFDGLLAAITTPFAATDATGDGTVSVQPPPGASGQNATVTVYNSDGQNSMFLQEGSPFVYPYPQAPAPAATISVAALPQGIAALVNVTSSTMQFVDGLTTLGFGTGDVVTRRLWVLSPNQLVADVTVAPGALERSTIATVISGFRVYEQTVGFQVLPAVADLPAIGLPVANANPLQNSLYPGTSAAIYGSNLQAGGTPSVTVSGQAAQILYAAPNQVNFVVPSGLPTGPAVMNFSNGSMSAYPIALPVDPPPPVIASASSATGTGLGSTQGVAPGATITLTVAGLDPSVVSDPSRVTVTEGGLRLAATAFTIQPATSASGGLQIQVALSPYIMGQQVPVTVAVDGDLSLPFYLTIATGN